jgi:acyl-CoA synthetase (NDP forming)
MDLTPLLEPRSIAVVGATDRPDAYGDTILRNLERLGFDGPLYGVNPGRSEIRGIECVATVDDLPEPVDAVAVAIPAAAVPDAVEAIARRGCGGAVVVSAGFGEVGTGVSLERRLRDVARAAGLPVCGPNGNGVVSFAAGAGIWGDSVQALEPGPVALISQSGNVAVNALGSHRGIGFHTVISTGNGTVCDAGDWLLALSERDGVGSIGLFLESDGEGTKLAEGLARCAERGIRAVVLKVGSSDAGAGAAAAHTGALAGDQRIFRALVEEAGGSWARNPHELLELSRVLAEPRARPAGTGGLAVLTCSGGDSGVAADEAERLGIEFPALAEATRERLGELLPQAATVANPLDYTSQIWAETERLGSIAEAVGDDPAVDQLLIFHDTPEDLSVEASEGWAATRAGLVGGANRSDAAAIFASTLPDLISEEIIRELSAGGIASVGGLSTAVLCARELRRAPGDPDRLRGIAAAAPVPSAGGGDWLGEAESKSLLRDAGIPVPAGRIVADAREAVAAAAEVGYPLALKLSSPAIQHKSELGALALGVSGDAELRRAVERLLALPAPADSVLLVERMAPSGVELVVAARADAVVPALVVGLGGIWTEALDDAAVVPLPASPERVEEALRSLRGARLLTGDRGSEAVDLGAVACAASRLGDLLLGEHLELIELNPLIVGPAGCMAADALARRR